MRGTLLGTTINRRKHSGNRIAETLAALGPHRALQPSGFDLEHGTDSTLGILSNDFGTLEQDFFDVLWFKGCGQLVDPLEDFLQAPDIESWFDDLGHLPANQVQFTISFIDVQYRLNPKDPRVPGDLHLGCNTRVMADPNAMRSLCVYLGGLEEFLAFDRFDGGINNGEGGPCYGFSAIRIPGDGLLLNRYPMPQRPCPHYTVTPRAARNSSRVLACFAALHDRQAGTILLMSSVPPRARGIT